MFPYDPDLLAAVRSTPESIDDVLATMNAMQALFAPGDGLKWFNWLYLQVTEAVHARVLQGGFSDPAWMSLLDVQFARLYFSALDSFLCGQPAPECWAVVFCSRSNAALARIQFALAGINAHINHDLTQAIVNTCEASGSVPEQGSKHYADYTAINSTLDSLTESAKRELLVRLLGDPMPEVSHLEDLVAGWSISAARESAWVNAEVLWNIRQSAMLSSRFMVVLDGFATVAGKALLVPVP